MVKIQTAIITIISTISLVLAGAVCAIAEPADLPTLTETQGGATQLDGISPQSLEQWPWQQGGSHRNYGQTAPVEDDDEIQQGNRLPSFERYQQESNDWQNTNVGEPHQRSSGIPVLKH